MGRCGSWGLERGARCLVILGLGSGGARNFGHGLGAVGCSVWRVVERRAWSGGCGLWLEWGVGMGVWSGEWDLFVMNLGRGVFGSWAGVVCWVRVVGPEAGSI